jgi:hypothetical protein
VLSAHEGMFQRLSLRISWYFVDLVMGYFYFEAKTFEVLSKIGHKGIHFAERSKGVYQSVCFGNPTIGWLSKIVE